MLVGRPPFKAASEYLTFQRIAANDYTIPDTIPGPAKEVICSLLSDDPDARPGGLQDAAQIH
jgi:3-phosphoinositide dependent protein kinase-1